MFAVSMSRTEAAARRILAERRKAQREEELAASRQERETRRREKIEAIEAERERLAQVDAMLAQMRRAAYYQTNNEGDRFHGTMDVIILEIAKVTGVLVYEIKGRSRASSKVRFDVMAAIKYLKPSCSMPVIGKKLGGRDHTTIMYGLSQRGWLTGEGRWENGRPVFWSDAVNELVTAMENGEWKSDESQDESGEDQGQAGQATA